MPRRLLKKSIATRKVLLDGMTKTAMLIKALRRVTGTRTIQPGGTAETTKTRETRNHI